MAALEAFILALATTSTAATATVAPPLAIIETKTETASTAPSSAPIAVALRISGYVQADAVLYDQSSLDEVNPSTGDPLNDTRVLIRRARLRADAVHDFTSASLELDANTVRGPTARIVSAEVSARWPPPGESAERDAPPIIMATIGLFKIPFGFEVQEKTEARRFLESGNAARALFPGDYDLGIKLQGGFAFLRYQLALMNGDPTGERLFPGRDPNESRDVLGRVGVAAELFDGIHVDAGFSALAGTGFHKGTPSTKDQIVWRDVNENGLIELSELQAIAGTAATPSKNFSRSGLGGDLRIRARLPVLGELFVYGELIWAVNLDRGTILADPVAAGRDLRERGLSLGLAQELGKYVIAGVRWDHYNPDADATDQRGPAPIPKDSSFQTICVTAALRWPPWGKLMIQYDHNTNALGRGETGAPASLADDALTLRAQLGF